MKNFLHEKKCITQLCFILMLGFSQLTLAQPWAGSGYKWEPVPAATDEFNGSLDWGKWTTNPVGDGWNWPGRYPGRFVQGNVKVYGGNLRIVADDKDRWFSGTKWTHGGGIVRSKYAIHPGEHGMYTETRMWANQTIMSSTFWLINKEPWYDSKCSQKYWRHKTELDVQECVGKVTWKTASWAKNIMHKTFASNAIRRETRCHGSWAKPTKINTGFTNSSGYHRYGVYWVNAWQLQFYLDGNYKYTIVPPVAFDEWVHVTMAVETYGWNLPTYNRSLDGFDKSEWARQTKYDYVRTWKRVKKSSSRLVNDDSPIDTNFDIEEFDAAIYPNPVETGEDIKINVKLPGKSDVTFSLVDLSGHSIYNRIYQNVDMGNIYFTIPANDIPKISPGETLILQVKTNSDKKSLKILIN